MLIAQRAAPRLSIPLLVSLWLLCYGTARAAPGEQAQGGPPPAEEGPGKKALLLQDKRERTQVRALRPPSRAAESVLTVHNLWTQEVLPMRREDPPPLTWNRFLRCHHTNQATQMDRRLLLLLRRAADRFQSRFVEVVSGFRAPKYNLMLRKKGHEVARDSQHTHGNAIDFRVAGVETRDLRRFVLSRHLGGVGYYPRSQFVHADTGPLRTWTAE